MKTMVPSEKKPQTAASHVARQTIKNNEHGVNGFLWKNKGQEKKINVVSGRLQRGQLWGLDSYWSTCGKDLISG